MHAAQQLAQSRALTDPRLHDALKEPAARMRDEIRAAGIPETRFWRTITSLAHQFENNRQLVMLTLRKVVGAGPQDEALVQRLAGHIGELEGALQSAVPNLMDELTLRARPIHQAWETYGRGMIRRIGKLTDERLIVDGADVVLVQPVLGGAGTAHLVNNSVRLEAVLTNNIPALPEVVRLTWLVAQLHQDLPMFSERIHGDRLPRIAELAALPATLQAASELELCAYDPPALAHALTAWQIETARTAAVAENLWLWWQTFQTTETPWAIALAALDELTAELEQSE